MTPETVCVLIAMCIGTAVATLGDLSCLTVDPACTAVDWKATGTFSCEDYTQYTANIEMLVKTSCEEDCEETIVKKYAYKEVDGGYTTRLVMIETTDGDGIVTTVLYEIYSGYGYAGCDTHTTFPTFYKEVEYRWKMCVPGNFVAGDADYTYSGTLSGTPWKLVNNADCTPKSDELSGTGTCM